MKDELGDRQKMYEGQESDRRFMPLLPICVRLDGKCFSKFTKGLKRPYDTNFSDLMLNTTKYLVEETNANIGYTQSDEISLIYYSDSVKSQVFFDGRIQKMNSILASMCSVYFNFLMRAELFRSKSKLEYDSNRSVEDVNYHELWIEKAAMMPIFDCRVWTVPNLMEACNVLVFRELDCFKNSITMAVREYYSDNELFKKNGSQKQEMLFSKGINFNNYPSFFKRGTYIQRRKVMKKFTIDEIDKLPPRHEARENPNLEIERTEIRILDLPPLNKIVNKVDVIFNGAEAKVKVD